MLGVASRALHCYHGSKFLPYFIIVSSFSTSNPCEAGAKAVYRLGGADGRKTLVVKGNGLLLRLRDVKIHLPYKT